MSAAFGSVNITYQPVVCYVPTVFSTNGAWQGDNPLDHTLPLFLIQLLLIVLLSRAVSVLLEPLHQPRYLVQILCGVLLGPTGLGYMRDFSLSVFPLRAMLVLETLGQLGLIYFMFIVGVSINISMVVRRMGKAVIFALPCLLVPFAIGALAALYLAKPLKEHHKGSFAIILGITLSVSAFSIVARTISTHRIAGAAAGATALFAGVFIDATAWLFVSAAFTLANGQIDFGAVMFTLLSGLVFLAVCVMMVRPAVVWVEKHTPEGEEVDDLYACTLLVGVMLAAFAADVIGINSLTGAFVYGLVFPTTGNLGSTLVERVEDFMEGILLPLFFTMSGVRANLFAVNDKLSAFVLVLVVLIASAGKVAASILVALFLRMPLRDGYAIGLLLNTKGVTELVILNLCRGKGLISIQSFSVLLLSFVLVTAIARPLLILTARPSREGPAVYERRTVQWPDPDTELRLLLCLHSNKDVPAMVGLLDASYPTRKAPIFAYAIHLIELTSRATPMLVFHNTANSKEGPFSQPAGAVRVQAQSETVVSALDSYEQQTAGVSIQPVTSVSHYATMQEDVCNIACDKGIALVVLPYHKQQSVESGMDVSNLAVRAFNEAILANAPCSAAVLVDHGIGGAMRMAGGHHVNHHIAVVFIGGADDREALAYACRMAEHPGNSLLVLRLVPDEREQRGADDEYVGELRMKMTGNDSVVFRDEKVTNTEEAVAAIWSIGTIHDLYIVGRAERRKSPLTAGLEDGYQSPDLGLLGNFLASPDFSATVSVLVVQQCAAMLGDHDNNENEEEEEGAESSNNSETPMGKLTHRRPTAMADRNGTV